VNHRCGLQGCICLCSACNLLLQSDKEEDVELGANHELPQLSEIEFVEKSSGDDRMKISDEGKNNLDATASVSTTVSATVSAMVVDTTSPTRKRYRHAEAHSMLRNCFDEGISLETLFVVHSIIMHRPMPVCNQEKGLFLQDYITCNNLSKRTVMWMSASENIEAMKMAINSNELLTEKCNHQSTIPTQGGAASSSDEFLDLWQQQWCKFIVLNTTRTVDKFASLLLQCIKSKSDKHDNCDRSAGKVHIFGADLWENLMDIDNIYNEYSTLLVSSTNDKNLFEFNLWLIPISCPDGHWSLIAIFPLRHEIHYIDALELPNSQKVLENALKFVWDLHLHQNLTKLPDLKLWKLYEVIRTETSHQSVHPPKLFGLLSSLLYMECLCASADCHDDFDDVCCRYDRVAEEVKTAIESYESYVGLCLLMNKIC